MRNLAPIVSVMTFPENTSCSRLGRRQELARRCQVPVRQIREPLEIHLHGIEDLRVLGDRARAGANHVPEVVQDEAGHQRVEVDDTDPLAGHIVDQHIVALAVVVCRPQRQRSAADERGQAIEGVCVLHQERDLRTCIGGSVQRVPFEGIRNARNLAGPS